MNCEKSFVMLNAVKDLENISWCIQDPSRSFRMTIQDDNTSRNFRNPFLIDYKIICVNLRKSAFQKTHRR